MGPLFSAFIVAILVTAYAGVSYLFVRIVTRKAVPVIHVTSIVIGGAVGAAVAVVFGGALYGTETIKSSAAVLFYLSFVGASAILFSALSYRFITKWKH